MKMKLAVQHQSQLQLADEVLHHFVQMQSHVQVRRCFETLLQDEGRLLLGQILLIAMPKIFRSNENELTCYLYLDAITY